jgi:O6-methylguanine-DNA--protein-cysteine methyltransferase
MDSNLVANIFLTPRGWAGVAVSAHGVARVVLPGASRRDVTKELGIASRALPHHPAGPLLERVARLLSAYFSGAAVQFDLPLDLRYYTVFQRAVWKATADIPYGETRTYSWVARRIGRPRAARAAGQALGANPVPVLVP